MHVSVEERRADFFVAAPIERGDELTFNYGEGFWLAARQRPSEGTDSRSFDDPACGNRRASIRRRAENSNVVGAAEVGRPYFFAAKRSKPTSGFAHGTLDAPRRL